ncbi:MAG: hypothetical protein ABG776_19720, partial [Cyanobacteria bacterium J06555_13]
ETIFFKTASDRTLAPVILPESGTYALVVTGAGETGEYSFRLLEMTENSVNITDKITTSDEVSVQFDDGMATQLYEFSGSAGQTLVFDSVSSSGFLPGRWRLYGPDNVALGSSSTFMGQDFTEVLPVDGTYTLILDGANATSFDFSFKVSEKVVDETVLILGSSVSGRIATPEEQDIYRFSGSAGQRVLIDGLSSESFNIQLQLVSPTGEFLVNRLSASRNSEVLTLPASGTYSITVNGANVTGDYSFRVLDLAEAEPLTLGVDLTNTLESNLATAIYTFDGTAGQALAFDMVDTSSPFGGSWALYGPVANTLIARNRSLDDFDAVLPADGTYTLVIDGNDNSPISYTFTVSDTTPSISVVPSGFNTVQTGTLATADQADVFTFDAIAGTRFIFDGLSSSSSNIRAQLTAPNGSTLFSSLRLTDDFAQLTLPESGAYSVTVTTSSTLGDYSFRLLDLNDAKTIPLDTLLNGSLEPGRGIGLYQFTGTAGQTLFFDGISSSGFGRWRLYSPDNVQLSENSLTRNFRETLPANGTYTLLIDGADDSAFDFNVQIATAETQVTTLTIGNTISGALAAIGEQDIYRFSGTAGQTLLFDGLLNTNNANARLISPTGIQIF